MSKKKQQQKAQSRQGNALHRQQERVARNIRLVERAEKRWVIAHCIFTYIFCSIRFILYPPRHFTNLHSRHCAN